MSGNGKFGYMDRSGQWIVPAKAGKLFSDSLTLEKGQTYYFVAEERGKRGVVDMSGDYVIPPIYDRVSFNTFDGSGDRQTSVSPDQVWCDYAYIWVVFAANKSECRGIEYLLHWIDRDTGGEMLKNNFYTTGIEYHKNRTISYDTKTIRVCYDCYGDRSYTMTRIIDFNGDDVMPPIVKGADGRNTYYAELYQVDGKPAIKTITNKFLSGLGPWPTSLTPSGVKECA